MNSSIEFTHFAVIKPFSYEIYGVGESADDARVFAAVWGGARVESSGRVSYAFEELAVVSCTKALADRYHLDAKRMGFVAEMHNIVGVIFKKVDGGICLPEEIEEPRAQQSRTAKFP